MIKTAVHTTSRVEINLAKIAHNVTELVALYGSKGIDLMGVTKTVGGNPRIANVFMENGIRMLADSKVENLRKMREDGVVAQFVLLKTPAISEIEAVIKYADISMNSELIILQQLSVCAERNNKVHQIILMIEMGDLREGIMPVDLKDFITEVQKLSGVVMIGIGANFACFGGVEPSVENMKYLTELAKTIELEFALPNLMVSGGNSANYNWFNETEDIGAVNNLRLGESIYLGREPINRKPIPGLFTDAFTFVSEVIESKIKPSIPYGKIGQNAFGNHPEFHDYGSMKRIIMACGSQDVLVPGLTPLLDMEILGSSSDHTIIDARKMDLKVGDEVRFALNYGALLSVMNSFYVAKKYIN
ncbi:alanine/ornithine racemase family PLP-dependent enzyme [Virgibacillus flavescens]|uniref:alanine/ornithine racemase family PLP-dependent enzyme n=1 Tax=Virgibacillus flavescens TaxID=1611422 RepID=UPI003D33DA6F